MADADRCVMCGEIIPEGSHTCIQCSKLREKIADTLNATEISVELEKRDIYKFADALIAAGIGDVGEWKDRAKVAEKALRKKNSRN